ncbi:hypothetical protein BDV97DRAFT_375102 [Delphinella strobiligena]|nr:hypothetical protein BDV97DRAFT_375102 [Delphinella strobiligena]
MDFINKLTGQNEKSEHTNTASSSEHKQSGGFMDRLNAAAGGGPESEKNEDLLDKGVDYVQEHFLGQGPQNNESALEQAKDEQISDYIRRQYKSTTGHEFPIADK